MATSKDSLIERLAHSREIHLTVTGRKSGKPVTVPVWFVLEGHTLYLVPVQGSNTQWYKNVLNNSKIGIDARGTKAEFEAALITDPKEVSPVVEKFRDKYGVDQVKKYYPKHDVAILVQLP